MSTKAQIEANRSNAQLSTGPSTPEGKAASSRNSYQHGFRSSSFTLKEEDRPEYDQIAAELRVHFGPIDLTEQRLVREMIDAEFHLRRCRSNMQSALRRQMNKIRQAEPDLDPIDLESRAIETLSETGCSWTTWLRYESGFQRQYDRAYGERTRYLKEITKATDQSPDVRIVRRILDIPHDAPLRLNAKLASSVHDRPVPPKPEPELASSVQNTTQQAA